MPNQEIKSKPETVEQPRDEGLDVTICSPLPPIRTVEEYRASFAEWEGAMMVSTATDDRDEMRRAEAACIREEKRWDECDHLFEFDEEGDIIGLANA